ncbi:MAG: AMP-binding protein [Desulfobacterales bacterium]
MNVDSELNMMRRFCVGDILRRVSCNKPHKTAFIYSYAGEIKRRLTFKELNTEANRFANALKQMGVEKGDRIAIISYNCIQYVIYVLALAKIGAWITPFNFALKGREIKDLVNHSEPVMLIVEDDITRTILEIADELPSIKNFIMIDLNGKTPLPKTWLDFDSLCSEQYPDDEPNEIITGDDVCCLMYTSGTEAMPKGVMNTHGNWYATLLSGLTDFGRLMSEDSLALGVAPFFHVAGISAILGYVNIGATTVLLHRPDPDLVMKAFRSFKFTDANLAPTVLANLLNMPEGEKLIRSLFGSLRYATLYGSPTNDAMMKKIMDLLPNTSFQNYYGQSELTPLGTTLTSKDLLRKMKESNQRFNGAEAIGQSHAMVEMKIVDSNDDELPPGETGEMVARGPSVMLGYYKEEEKTDATFKNGWHHTGDLAVMDEERFYYFVDRKKDIIKSGAENISSVEIEQWIATHPKVGECCVLGLYHPKWVEAVTAFVVPQQSEKITSEEIRAFCKEGLAGYKVPKKVIILDEIPKLPSGKFLKRDLKSAYQHLYEDV